MSGLGAALRALMPAAGASGNSGMPFGQATKPPQRSPQQEKMLHAKARQQQQGFNHHGDAVNAAPQHQPLGKPQAKGKSIWPPKSSAKRELAQDGGKENDNGDHEYR